MNDIIEINVNNYRQYAPFDIVVAWEMREFVDKSGRIFRVTPIDGKPFPLHEIFNVTEDATLNEVFHEDVWMDFHTGLGTGGWIHRSIGNEFCSRTKELSPLKKRECWREVVLELVLKP